MTNKQKIKIQAPIAIGPDLEGGPDIKFTGKLNLGGLELNIVSDEDAAKADLRICSPDRYFPDDLVDVCQNEGCGRTIYFRPHGPMNVKRVCLPCAALMSQEVQA